MKRLHNTNAESLFISKHRRYHQATTLKGAFKPHGLWYSIGNQWLEWCNGNMPEWVRKYQYKIEIDYTDILVIDNVDDLIEFHKLWSYELYPGSRIKQIAWGKVSLKYKGLEIRNFHSMKWDKRRMHFDLHLDTLWLDGWDVDSGCLWDLSAVTGIKRTLTNKKWFNDERLQKEDQEI